MTSAVPPPAQQHPYANAPPPLTDETLIAKYIESNDPPAEPAEVQLAKAKAENEALRARQNELYAEIDRLNRQLTQTHERFSSCVWYMVGAS